MVGCAVTVGHNGYMAVVPGTQWAACAVHASWAGHVGMEPGTWIRTDVAHIGDDPSWKLLDETGEDGPDNRAINAIHRGPFMAIAVLSREYGQHIDAPLEAATWAIMRKALRAEMRRLPGSKVISLFDGRIGCVR